MIKESSILRSLGIVSLSIDFILIIISILIILVIVLLTLTIIQMKKTKDLSVRLKKFMTGKNMRNLESEVASLFEDCRLFRVETEKNTRDIKDIYHTLKGTYQKCGIVKYDAFNQMGGQLSFCLAMLDEKNNGFILNSVHSNEGNYTYIKQIKSGISDVELGTEEAIALQEAVNKK